MTINSPLTALHSQIHIYNVLGEKIYQSIINLPASLGFSPDGSPGGQLTIDLTDKPQGIYIVQLITGGAFYQQRIVKN